MTPRRRHRTAAPARPGEDFLTRFNRLKTEARHQAPAIPADPDLSAAATTAAPSQPTTLTDADMPPLASLNFDADFSGFLSPTVSDQLRKQALRQLFHSIELNRLDGLDEYAEDFTNFEPLGDLITADMRHQAALAQAQRQSTPTTEDDSAEQPSRATPPAEDDPTAADAATPASATNNAADIATDNGATGDDASSHQSDIV